MRAAFVSVSAKARGLRVVYAAAPFSVEAVRAEFEDFRFGAELDGDEMVEGDVDHFRNRRSGSSGLCQQAPAIFCTANQVVQPSRQPAQRL